GFEEAAFDELEHARLVARTFGTEHHEQVCAPDALNILDELTWYLDEPLGDPSVIPTYMVSRLAAESVTVVLSGDGGDELLAGHDPWSDTRRWLGNGRLYWLSALQYADLNTYLPLDILTKVDRMSMAHSIEARVPLLDHKVVEFAATIPPELQLHRGITK